MMVETAAPVAALVGLGLIRSLSSPHVLGSAAN
jgi:hypothetical protein